MSAQAQTVAAVAQRGYLDGWTDGELLALQVVKLVEELAELCGVCLGRRSCAVLTSWRIVRRAEQTGPAFIRPARGVRGR